MFLVVFEITSEEIRRGLVTEHGRSKWSWETEAESISDYCATCLELCKSSLTNNLSSHIVHTSRPIYDWLIQMTESTFQCIEYQMTRSPFRNKLIADWFDEITDADRYGITLAITIRGDISYEKVWDVLITNAKKYRGDVSLVELKGQELQLTTLDHGTQKLKGSAIGDPAYLIDPLTFSDDRRLVLRKITYFDRLFTHLDRIRSAQVQAQDAPENTASDYRIKILSTGNTISLARVLSEELSWTLSDALAHLNDMPLHLDIPLTMAEARGLKRVFEETGATVSIEAH